MGDEKVLDLMLEATNHRFQDTTDRFCLKSFSEHGFGMKGLLSINFMLTSRPDFIVSPICESSRRCPERSLAFDKLCRLQYCIHRSIG